jgi:hypothetical protein
VRGRPSARIGVPISVIRAIFARVLSPATVPVVPEVATLAGRVVAASAVLGVLASLAFAAPAARADGDPASDVLAVQNLFAPLDLGVSRPVEQLQALLTEAARHGFALRVALIGSQFDLGTVGALWGRPGAYARFLGTELSELYGGQVLVVMPRGFGLYGPAHGPHAATAAEERVVAPTPAEGPRLVSSAIAAVGLLARAAGHPVTTPPVSGARSAGGSGGTDDAALVAFAAGLLAIGVAWGVSLSRRPLRLRGRASA